MNNAAKYKIVNNNCKCQKLYVFLTSLVPFCFLSFLVHLIVYYALSAVPFDKFYTSEVKYGYVEVLDSDFSRLMSWSEASNGDHVRTNPLPVVSKVSPLRKDSTLTANPISSEVSELESRQIDKTVESRNEPRDESIVESPNESPNETSGGSGELNTVSERSVPLVSSIAVGQTDPVVLVGENAPPEYPLMAVKRSWEGDVLLNVSVLADGSVASTSVVESSGFIVLDDSAQRAVKEWKFTPAKRGEQNIDGELLMPVSFKLR